MTTYYLNVKDPNAPPDDMEVVEKAFGDVGKRLLPECELISVRAEKRMRYPVGERYVITLTFDEKWSLD